MRESPAAITTLTALTGVSGGEIELSWSAPGDDTLVGILGTEEDPAAFHIQHTSVTAEAENPVWWDKEEAQIIISTYNVNAGDMQYYTVEELEQGATYYFRIWTRDEEYTWSLISNGATNWAQISPDTVSPGSITCLSALAGTWGGQIDLSWSAPGDDGYTGNISSGEYRIQYSTDATPDMGWNKDNYDIKWTTDAVQGENQYRLIDNFTEGTTYYFRIWTRDEVSNNWSQVSNGATNYARIIAPASVTTLSALTGDTDGEINLSWSSPGDDGNTGILNGEYRIDYATSSKSWDPNDYRISIPTSIVNPGDEQSWVIENLTGLATYYFRIWTRDEITDHWSPISNGATNWAQAIAPAAITNISALPGTSGGYIDLSWSAPGDDGNTGILNGEYRIDYGTYTKSWDFTDYEISITTGNVNPEEIQSRTVTGLREGATYYFRIWTSDDGVQANWSDISNGATNYAKRQPPEGITNLSALTGMNGGDIDLSWSSPGDDGWIGIISTGTFRIDYSTESSTQWSVSNYKIELSTNNSQPLTAFNRTVTGLDEGTTYYFRIWTSDEAGNWSGLSNGATTWAMRESPASITTLSALTGTNGGYVDLNWSSPGDDGQDGDLTGSFRIKYSTEFAYSWQDPPLTDYDIELSTNNSQPLTMFNRTITGLTEGSTYYFRIWTADDADNWSGLSNGATSWAFIEAPASVTTLSALTGTNGGEINLSWISPGDDGWNNILSTGTFRIDYSTESSTQWSVNSYKIELSTNDSQPLAVFSRTATGLIEGTTYYFRIWTADDVGIWSDISNGATTYARTEAPAAITDLTGIQGLWGGEVTLSWTSPGDDNWTGTISSGVFHIDYATYTKTWDYNDYKTVISTYNLIPLSNSQHLITGLYEGTTYYFRIWTADENNEWSTLSNGATVWAQIISPAAITEFSGSPGTSGGEVELEWSAPGDDGWTGIISTGTFRIDYSTFSEYQFQIDQYQIEIDTNNVSSGEDHSRVVSGLIEGSTYYFRIWTADEVNRWSEISLGATSYALSIPPAAITTLSGLSNLADEIKLTWSAPGDDEVEGQLTSGSAFYIATTTFLLDAQNSSYWTTKRDSSEIQLSTSGVNPWEEQNYTITNLVEGTTYYFRIWTFDESNRASEISDGSTVCVMRIPPAAITNLSALAGRFRSINLTWTSPFENSTYGGNASYYDLRYATDSFTDVDWDASWVTQASEEPEPGIPGSNEEISIFGLERGTTYYFRIKSIDDVGNVSSINTAMQNTLPGEATAAPWSDDIEEGGDSAAGIWEKTSSVTAEWERGTPSISQADPQYNSASNCWSTDLDADYVANSDIQLITPEIDLSGTNEPRLRFWHYLRAESGYDGALIMISTNSGVSWMEIAGSSITPTYDGILAGGYGNPHEGLSAWSNNVTWEKVVVELDHYKNKVISIKFCFGSDDGSNSSGWFIDDVRIGSEEVSPASVTNLTALAESDGDVLLSWTAPGDDGFSGTISTGAYRIDYATHTKNWSHTDYKIEIATANVNSGDKQGCVITGLTGGATYYFSLWTSDEAGNWSGVSNGATTTVVNIVDFTASTDTLNLGSIWVNTSSVTLTQVSVVNIGNVNLTYSLKISSITLYDGSPSKWSAATSTETAPALNEFILYSVFHGTAAAVNYFTPEDITTDSPQESNNQRFTYEGGSTGYEQTGVGVPPGEERKLWFRIDMPTAVSTKAEEKIKFNISAVKE
ncbi:hypothetical protein ACFLR5_01830 [Elusimicrobiota bacterium]